MSNLLLYKEQLDNIKASHIPTYLLTAEQFDAIKYGRELGLTWYDLHRWWKVNQFDTLTEGGLRSRYHHDRKLRGI